MRYECLVRICIHGIAPYLPSSRHISAVKFFCLLIHRLHHHAMSDFAAVMGGIFLRVCVSAHQRSTRWKSVDGNRPGLVGFETGAPSRGFKALLLELIPCNAEHLEESFDLRFGNERQLKFHAIDP